MTAPGPGRRGGRALLLALLGIGVLLLGGCVGLQTDGPVRQGLEVGGSSGNPVTVLPPGPEPGASPEEIIRGFLRAGAASQGQMSVARSFLTDDLAPMWDPDAGTTVMGGEPRVDRVGKDRSAYRVSAPVTATIDGHGRYSYAAPDATKGARIGVVQRHGQWRIDSLPDGFGRWLDSSVINRLFRSFNIYYVAVGSSVLVPDVRWLPLDKQATRLARASLDPVPTYLAGAAQSSLATGVTLTVDAVPVVRGVATVDLAAAGLPPDPTARKNIWAQLVATLTQASDVSSVTVTVEGAALSLPDVAGPVSSVAEFGMSLEPPAPDAKPVLRVGDRVLPLAVPRILSPGDDGLTDVRTPFPDVSQEWSGLAESRSGEEIAAVGPDGSELARWRHDRVIEVPFFATDLTRPSYDRHDILWIGGRGTGAYSQVHLWAVNTAADPADRARSRPIPIRVRWLVGRDVVAVRVSPDGQRVAVLSTDADGGDLAVQVSGIVRRPNGVPSGLSPAGNDVAPYLTRAADVTWISTTRVAVLGRMGAEDRLRPYLIDVGGERESLSEVPDAASITTTGGERGLAVVTGDDQVVLRAGQTWLTAPVGSDLAVPGT